MDARTRAIPTEARYRVYGMARQWGILNVNEIRRKENENSIGPTGDRYLEPENMHEAGEDPPPPPALPPPAPPALSAPSPEADPAPAKVRMQAARRALLVDAVGRFVRRESAAAKKASKRGPQAFQASVHEFYEDAPGVLTGFLEPAVRFLWDAGGRVGDPGVLVRGLEGAFLERSRDELLELKASDLEAEVERRTARWELQRPVELAEQIATALDGRGGVS
jgi:hypothetical protein